MMSSMSRQNEKGFVLVTTLVLLAILTVLGVMSAYKTVVEIKVSKLSGDSAKALMVANAGLATVFDYWANDSAEFDKAITDMSNGTVSASATSTLFELTHSPSSLGDTTYLPSDADIQSASKKIWVYEMTDSTSFFQLSDKSTWGSSTRPQVAVWATRFNAPSNEYPYESPNRTSSASCANCRLVVYALGRMGETRRLVRQVMSTGDAKLDGVSALTNAPSYRNWSDFCSGTRNGGAQAYYGQSEKDAGNSVDVAWGCTSCDADVLVDATQADYVKGLIPSGIALASNTHIGGDSKNFRKGTTSTTIATFDSIPIIAYSGHGSTTTDTAMKVDYASEVVYDTPLPAPNLPNNKLPRKLVNDKLFDESDEVTYFQGSPNAHLFNLDVYRWAAEQFTCQTSGSGTTKLTTAATGSGKYCLQADALRAALGNPAPVTGRLTMAEFEYNMANSIPMFGMVRVMYPVYQTSTTALGTCAALGGASVYPYDTAEPTARVTNTGSYSGNATTLDLDVDGSGNPTGTGGTLGPNAKLIVYGSIFFDFFVDEGTGAANGNGTFDPESGERLVNAFEAADARMELELPAYVNPALPKFTSTVTATTFPTGASGHSGTISTNTGSTKPSGVAINLASPSGWFPSSEGRIPSTSDNSVGSMAVVDNLVAIGLQITPSSSQGGGGLTLSTSNAPSLYTNSSYINRFKYYYDLMYASANRGDSNGWPMSPASAPSVLTGNICIGSEDCAVGNNDGDKLHVLFPSGYHHGWKVALAALDMTANDWNSMFSNLSALASSLKKTSTSSYNHGSSQRPRGSPFNATLDTGFGSTNLTNIKDGQALYFYITPDSGSGYGLLDGSWRDIPAMIYAGGLVDTHEHNNVSGIIYTPGPLEWETGKISGGTGYVTGAIITGFGQFTENSQVAKQVYVYDNQAVDNINTTQTNIVLRRYAWQEL